MEIENYFYLLMWDTQDNPIYVTKNYSQYFYNILFKFIRIYFNIPKTWNNKLSNDQTANRLKDEPTIDRTLLGF